MPHRVFDTSHVTRVDPDPPPAASVGRPTHSRGGAECVLLLIGAEVCRHVDFPFRAAGVVFAVAAMILGVWLMTRRGRPARSRRLSIVMVLGTSLAGVLLIWHVALLVFQPVIGDYERCLGQALTQQAQQSCQDGLRNRFGALGGAT